MKRRTGVEIRWAKWAVLVVLGATLGCGPDWQREIEELGRGRADHGGPTPEREGADSGAHASVDAGATQDPTSDAAAPEGNDAAPSNDVTSGVDVGADGENSCAEDGGTVCGPYCCQGPNFICISNDHCSPACSHAYPVCGGGCCPLDTYCMNNTCVTPCHPQDDAAANAGTCPDGGACTLGTTCEVATPGPLGT